MIRANFNAYSKYVTDSLYQWDLNQVLTVHGLNLTVAPEIHFSNANTVRAIVRQTTMVDHVITAKIPNSLLQDPLRIHAYIGVYEGDVFKVIELVEIPVIPKPRPEDYRIEGSDEEIYSFNRLENLIAQIDEKWSAFTTDTVNEAVNNWLDDHPDATTTVQDGAITEAKFSDELKLHTIKDYVTPQMFGAKGDGVTDDTDAIQNAIEYAYENNRAVFVPKGTYIVSKPLYLYENMKLTGEGEHYTTIHKISNVKGDKTGFAYDSIIILCNSDFGTDTYTQGQRITDIALKGCQTGDPSEDEYYRQYAIIAPHDSAKITITNFRIGDVDYGIYASKMWMSRISDSEWLRASCKGIYIDSESQGLTISNVNIAGTTEAGIDLGGGVYSTLSNILVEWLYGGIAYNFRGWGGHVINCGYEVGDGVEIGFKLHNSNIKLSGCYFYGTTNGDISSADCSMIHLYGSTMEINTSNFGYDIKGGKYVGSLAYIKNSHLILDESNVYNCTFAKEILGEGDYAYLTIEDRTIDVRMGNISLRSSRTTNNTDYDTLDGKINPVGKYPRRTVYLDNINNPLTNSFGSNAWGYAFNKGDIGFINNPTVNGKAAWICNRDNSADTPLSVGTVTAVNSGNIIMSDLALENYAKTGIRLYKNATIIGENSGAVRTISDIDYSGKCISFSSGGSGTFSVGEKIRLKSTAFAKDGDFLFIPIINSGSTAERPTADLTVGQMYFDTTLNKPIWYGAAKKWVDATGANV